MNIKKDLDVPRCRVCGRKLPITYQNLHLCGEHFLFFLNQITAKNNEKNMRFREAPRAGGLIIPKSRCCGAPLKKTEGIITEICSKCGKPNPPAPFYRH